MEEDMKEKKTRAKKPVKKQQPKTKHREKIVFSFKLFGKCDAVEVLDPSLKGYINTEGRLLPRSEGSERGRFHKSRMHIAERLALKLLIPGHTGKKHKLTSGPLAGNYSNVISAVEKALDIIHQKEKKNPLEVLVKAVENASVREEVVSYKKGSVIAREAVVSSPQRRVDKTLKYIAQSTYRKAFKSKKKLPEALADELIAASKGSSDSFAIKEKERIEREASGAR